MPVTRIQLNAPSGPIIGEILETSEVEGATIRITYANGWEDYFTLAGARTLRDVLTALLPKETK